MNTTKITGIILILLSLGIGYIGFNKIEDSSKTINLLGLKIEASNTSDKQEGYLYVGFAIIFFIGGIFTVNKSKL